MSNRKIIHAASTGGISYYPVVGASDPYYDKVSLLLNGDTDVDDNFANVSLLLTGNDLLDKSNNKITVTNTGTVTVSSAIKKFGTGSMAFSGSNYLSLSSSSIFNFGTGDFTVECWVYKNVSGLRSYYSIGDYVTGLLFRDDYFSFVNTGAVSLSAYIPLTTWTHTAVVRNSSSLKVYVNGTSVYSASVAVSHSSTGGVSIGTSTHSVSEGMNGYIDDLRITKGYARYTTNFTPPTQALPSHEILDSSVYRFPATTYGNARIDTATKKFGTGSMYFDGSGDAITLSPGDLGAFGTGNFTIELYIKCVTLGGGVIDFRPLSTNGAYPLIMISANGSVLYYTNDVVSITSATGAVITGNWYHIAVARSSGITKLYIDGNQVGSSYTDSNNYVNAVNRPVIGSNGWYAPMGTDSPLNCYIDDLRITKGVARYTANFTPPTAALPTIPPTIAADPWWGNVSLLLDGNTTDAYDPYWQNVSLMLTGDDFIDWSNQHNAITVTNAVIDKTNKKFNSSSISFDGVGDYISAGTSPGVFGTNDFTFEFWVRATGAPQGNQVIISNYAYPSTTGFSLLYHDATALKFASGTTVLLTSSGGWSFNEWHHVAIVRSSGTVTMYIDGASRGSVAFTNNCSDGLQYIGRPSDTSSFAFQGQIADLRITKGVARTITVPTAALPAFKIQDRTQNNLTLTPHGNVQLNTDVKKNGTGSMFFDGTGDYLSTGTLVTGLQLGTVDFTAECWVYHVSSAVGNETYFCCGSTGFDIRRSNTGKFEVVCPGVALIKSSTASILSNQWVHVCAVRISGITYLYINGVLDSSVADTTNYTGTGYFAIGATAEVVGVFPMKGYIDDLRITKGYARYTQNFTPPSQSFATQYISTGFDANYADVSLLLTGEGTNGSTTFTDLSSSPKTITPYGNAQISTAQKKYGTGSIAFDGSGDYLTVPSSDGFNFGSGNFTIEVWVYASGLDSFNAVFAQWPDNGATSNNSYVMESVGSSMYFYWVTDGGYTGATLGTITTGSWIYYTICRSGNTLYPFKNGVLGTPVSITQTLNSPTSNVTVGGNVAGSGFWNGYIDDLRITKGIARYTTNFTPPTYALATTAGTPFDVNRADTSLLLRGNGTNGSTSFTDESPNNLTITNNGAVTVNTTTKKYGTGSMSFSGSNYLTVASNSSIIMGTSDFTIEYWYYPNAFNNVTHLRAGADSASTFRIFSQTGANVGWYAGSIKLSSSGSTLLTISTWNHIAFTRTSGVLKLFVNGVQFGTTYADTTNYVSAIDTIGAYSSGSENINGYIDDLRITKGYARYTANFTPPTYEAPITPGTVYDYNFPQVSLLLNGDGTNGSTTFTDLSSSPKTITANGNVQLSTAVKKFGTASLLFDGTGDYLAVSANTAFNFGTGDFTVELWFNSSSFAAQRGLVSTGGYYTAGMNGNWNLRVTNSSTIAFAQYNGQSDAQGGWDFPIPAPVTPLLINTWYHLALVKRNNTVSVYINGVASGTTYNNTSSVSDGGVSTVFIGHNGFDSDWYGYIDDLRITKGLARYTANFTPPTAPLPTSYS